jgi:hypothetical protein
MSAASTQAPFVIRANSVRSTPLRRADLEHWRAFRSWPSGLVCAADSERLMLALQACSKKKLLFFLEHLIYPVVKPRPRYIFGFMLNQPITKKIWVFTSKAAFMQRVADYVRTGHQAYIRGVTPTETIFTTWEKLTRNNPVYDDKLKAFRARREGLSTGRLLMYQDTKKPEMIHWFLLIHGKSDQLPKGEKWLHAEDKHNRIVFTGYELVRITKEGQAKPSWTWRYESQRFQDLRDSMVQTIRSKRDQDLKITIGTIFGTMGFSGSREQAKSLSVLMQTEWTRRRPGEEMPPVPKGFGWIRRKADKGIFLVRPKMLPPTSKNPLKNIGPILDYIEDLRTEKPDSE